MSGLGKGVSGVVGISRNGSGAGTFPDTPSQKNIQHLARKHINDLGERTWSRIMMVECSKVMAAVSIV